MDFYVPLSLILCLMPLVIIFIKVKNSFTTYGLNLAFTLALSLAAFITIIPCLILEYFFQNLVSFIVSEQSVLRFYLVTAFIEEGCKLFTLYLFFNMSLGLIHTKKSKLVLVLLISLLSSSVFASGESLLYVFTSPITLFFRSILCFPLHLVCSLFLALAVYTITFSLKRRNALLYLLLPLIIHGTFDLLIAGANQYTPLVFPFLLISYAVLFLFYRNVKNHLAYNQK